jgi:hypothetical protein
MSIINAPIVRGIRMINQYPPIRIQAIIPNTILGKNNVTKKASAHPRIQIMSIIPFFS